MADFAEALPCHDIALHDGAPPCDYHNAYAVAWAALNRQVLRRAGKEGEVLVFSRSGFTRSPGQAILFWLGDQCARACAACVHACACACGTRPSTALPSVPTHAHTSPFPPLSPLPLGHSLSPSGPVGRA